MKDIHQTASLAQRIKVTRKIAAGPANIVTDLERRLGSPYTVDTLRWLKRRYPGVRFVWVMGSDNLSSLHRWRGWVQIVHETPMAVIARPGSAIRSRLAPAAVRFARYRLHSRQARRLPLTSAPAWLYMREPLNFSSSSAIRAGRGQSAP